MADFSKITCFLLDMDGVLTNGTVLVLDNGLQARQMSIRDGYAIQLAIRKGYRVAIVSGAESAPVIDRMSRLGVTEVFMAVKDKHEFIRNYAIEKRLEREQILFMGDDMPDLVVAGLPGIFACPADAIDEIRAVADHVSPLNGGAGCVREVIERVMKIRGNWAADPQVTSS